MLYAALTFWLLVLVFTAWGVHHIWSGLVKPRTVNLLLLPGTLVAQIGYVMGVLVSGGTVNNTTVIKDDETAEPQQDDNPKPRIPVIGPVLIGMLPLGACGVALYVASRSLGADITGKLGRDLLAVSLPVTMGQFWDLLRSLITLAQQAFEAVWTAELLQIPTAIFVYLVVCLTVRMAPFPGNLRGSIGAIVLLGVVAAVLGTALPAAVDMVHGWWPVLSLAVATLLALLLLSLAVRGLVELVRVLATQG